MWPSSPTFVNGLSPSFPAIILWGRSKKEGVVQWSSNFVIGPVPPHLLIKS